jgi:hypothetical protein
MFRKIQLDIEAYHKHIQSTITWQRLLTDMNKNGSKISEKILQFLWAPNNTEGNQTNKTQTALGDNCHKYAIHTPINYWMEYKK